MYFYFIFVIKNKNRCKNNNSRTNIRKKQMTFLILHLNKSIQARKINNQNNPFSVFTTNKLIIKTTKAV